MPERVNRQMHLRAFPAFSHKTLFRPLVVVVAAELRDRASADPYVKYLLELLDTEPIRWFYLAAEDGPPPDVSTWRVSYFDGILQRGG